MLLIHCPHCNDKLPELEFEYAGEAHIERPKNPDELNDTDWKDYLYTRRNIRGDHAEQWRHSHGCARYFNAIRNTVTDKFVVTYLIGQPLPDTSLLKDEDNE